MAAAAHAVSSVDRAAPGPLLGFAGLDVLWLQVAGTLCNIACRHCFITCGPKNDSHPMMTVAEVEAALAEARRLGVKEYYFTGGEPFLHPEIEPLVARTLAQGPLSILTNGLLIDEARAQRLRTLQDASPYGLDLRLSIDGTTPAENDPIRGRGTFERIMQAAQHLAAQGMDPVFTVTAVHARYQEDAGRAAFLDELRARGFARPRVKFIPPFRIGRERRRSGSYSPNETLREGDLMPGEEHILQCGSCRAVTANGVYPCPILVEEKGARMGRDLTDGLRPIRLNHPACVTCHAEGFSCRT